MEEKKNSKLGLGIVIGLLIAAVVGLGTFIVYDKVINKDEKGSENGNTVEPTKKNNDNKEVIKALDLNKCLNCEPETTYSYYRQMLTSSSGLSVQLNENKKSITYFVNWGTLKNYVQEMNDGKIHNYPIDFDKEIVNAYVGEIGQEIHGTSIIVFFKDGTIDYIPLFVEKYDQAGTLYYDMNVVNGTVTKKTIDSAKNVVEFYQVNVSQGIGSYVTVIAATRDGSYYDIYNLVK